jgi:hypothetical protein
MAPEAANTPWDEPLRKVSRIIQLDTSARTNRDRTCYIWIAEYLPYIRRGYFLWPAILYFLMGFITLRNPTDNNSTKAPAASTSKHGALCSHIKQALF